MSKPKILSHNYTGKSLVIVFSDSKGIHTKIVESSHANWKQVERAYKAQQYEKVLELVDVAAAINAKFQGEFVVKNGQVWHGNEVVHGYIFDRILFFMREGLPHKRLLAFAKNLYANPSEKARNELYKFLEHKNMPITDDGCFLAYKGVRDDYYSITSGNAKLIKGKANQTGHIFNGVGEVIEVDRSAVNPDANQGCSYGLHAGSFAYANDFKGSGRLLIVKINPKDVVSVPNDCNCQKLRACRYEVIAEEGRKLDEVKDSNFDKVAKLRHAKRDSTGRFCK